MNAFFNGQGLVEVCPQCWPQFCEWLPQQLSFSPRWVLFYHLQIIAVITIFGRYGTIHCFFIPTVGQWPIPIVLHFCFVLCVSLSTTIVTYILTKWLWVNPVYTAPIHDVIPFTVHASTKRDIQVRCLKSISSIPNSVRSYTNEWIVTTNAHPHTTDLRSHHFRAEGNSRL